MKKARLIISASMLTLAGFTALTLTSCSKDEDCAPGLEGKNCDVEIRTPMLGTYTATDTNDEDPTDIQAYTPVITKNSSVSIVNISNFGRFFEGQEIVTSNVTKSGDNVNFTIPVQNPANDEYEVSGSGTYNSKNSEITINYTLSNGSSNLNYHGTWTKQ